MPFLRVYQVRIGFLFTNSHRALGKERTQAAQFGIGDGRHQRMGIVIAGAFHLNVGNQVKTRLLSSLSSQRVKVSIHADHAHRTWTPTVY